jgi:ATP-dependent exoDNAse (exonuclease V) beta subunit
MNQSIFGFRHADPDVFRQYRDLVAASGSVDLLTENFRSREGILSAVSAALSAAQGIEPFALIAAREFPASADPAVELVHAASEDLEAAMIARRIVEQRDRFPFSRVAILVRSTTSLDILLPALAGAGIPYLLTKGRSFYETRESRDLLALLKSLANTCDEVSLCVVLRSPFAGVRDEDLLRLKLAGNLYESIAGERSHDGLRRFQEWFAGLHAVRDQLAPDRLLAAAIDSSDYSAGLDWRARANIEKFMSMVRDLWNARPRPLADLVADLDMLRQSQPEPEAPPASKPEAVQVMTVHAAKGLEFPVVFLPFLHRAVDRSSSPLLISPRFGLGARWHDPRSGEPAGDLAWRAAREDEKQRDLAESNRLLYVGMTRAEERLVLSYSRVSQWAAVVDGALPSHVTRCDAIPASTAPANPAEDSQPLVLPPPIIDGQHDSSASVTDIALFADCPRRYFLERYLKLPAAETPGGAVEPAGAEFGREVHAVLSGDGHTASTAARQLAGRFLSNPLAARLSRATRVEREFDIVFALDDLVLQGRIDLWFEEAGELVLVDYKTDLDPNDAYQHQLRLYALALEHVLGRRPDKALIFYLRTGAVISVNLEAQSIEATARVVKAFSEAQSELNFPLAEGERCRHCPYYWDACPAGLMPPAFPAKSSPSVHD